MHVVGQEIGLTLFFSLKGLVEEDDWETAEQLIRKVWDF